MKNFRPMLAAACIFAASSGPLWAATSVEEAKQLGTTLTPWGAERSGNKDGTIPAFTGEQIKPPADFDPKRPGRRPDPFDSDKPLVSINAQNFSQHADKLSEGQKEMFRKFPSFRMDIYQTRRTVNYPKYVVDNTLKNATSCKTDTTEDKLIGCYGGVPFPIPATGKQAMWNHLTQYKQSSWGGDFSSYIVGRDGKPILQAASTSAQASEFFSPTLTAPGSDNTIFLVFRSDTFGPARRNGEKLLIVNTLDSSLRAWQYIPGQRRVKLAPDLAYDTPNPQSGGVYTMDDSQAFFGRIDRYDFKLAGKKEMYIPYNNYKPANVNTCPATKLFMAGFPNPDCMRWELHRTWMVTATLKPGFRHIYLKRTFYWDEDIPGAGMADNFDAQGKIFRYSYVAPFVYYEGPGISADAYVVTDLNTGAYAAAGLPVDQAWHAMPSKGATYFSPESLAGEGIR